jgi:hypothetical protein
MFISSSLQSSTIRSLLLIGVLMLHGCGGEEDTAGANDKFKYCLEIYEPICGKALPEATLNCVQEPCPTHEYRTFPNACYAANAEAQFSFNDECDGLEDQLAFDDKPVQIKDLAEVPINNAPVTINSVEIEGDIVTLDVSYSGGCGPHEFNLFVINLFLDSNPVQTESILSHVTEVACDAVVTDELTFELLPLREFYQRIYGEGEGSINIQGIGTYTF